MTHWREFPDLDPELPAEVLPADWPRAAARECFVTIYDGLGPLAERRFAELLARHAPDLAPLAAHRTSEDVRRGEPPDGPAPSGDARTGWIGPLGRQ
jgi:phenylacetic acid degradation operon negative regulatory protein